MRKSILSVLLGAAVLFASALPGAQAGAVVTIQGRLISILENEYLIQTKHSVYHVVKTAVPQGKAKEFERPDRDVSLQVSLEDIKTVRPVKQ